MIRTKSSASIKVFFIVLFSWVGYAAYSQTSEPPATIPAFSFSRLADLKVFTADDLSQTGKIVFIFFDPGCGHCQEEAQGIGEHLDKFNNATFYFIAMQDKPLVQEFVDKYGGKLKGKENVHFLLDTNYEFIDKFNPKEYPSLYVYSSQKRLVKYLAGPKNIKTILAVVNP